MYHFELEIQLYIYTIPIYNAIVEHIGLTTSGALHYNIQMSIVFNCE